MAPCWLVTRVKFQVKVQKRTSGSNRDDMTCSDACRLFENGGGGCKVFKNGH